MPKRSSLSTTHLRTPGQQLNPAPEEAERKPEEEGSSSRSLKSRAKQMIVYLHPNAHRQLKQLALAEDVQMNDLAIEALNLLFQSRKLPQNAEPDR